MLRILGAVALGAIVWTTPASADILTNFAVTFGDESSTQSRAPGACWIRSASGWKCYKLNGIQCKTVARTNRNPGRYASAPKSCSTTRAPN